MRKNGFDIYRIFFIFVMSYIFQERGNLPIVDRHFLCLVVSIRRFRTPVWSINVPTIHHSGYRTAGQAELPFRFYPYGLNHKVHFT